MGLFFQRCCAFFLRLRIGCLCNGFWGYIVVRPVIHGQSGFNPIQKDCWFDLNAFEVGENIFLAQFPAYALNCFMRISVIFTAANANKTPAVSFQYGLAFHVASDCCVARVEPFAVTFKSNRVIFSMNDYVKPEAANFMLLFDLVAAVKQCFCNCDLKFRVGLIANHRLIAIC